MTFTVRQISVEQARAISTWRYKSPFSLYNLLGECSLLWEPTNRYYSVLDQEQVLIGYCCFGKEAKVLGGSYREQEPAVLDVGVGMHPDKTGKGLGSKFVESVLQFGEIRFSPAKFRVTVAAFNERSLKTFYKLGFKETYRFRRHQDGTAFVQLERAVKTSCDW